ncbi:T-cell receptor alpha chain V region HPB-MLT [Fukomys damarensis]|nr:T-cell receptor alpha chain V region HPB-MLT [Fukomys damarensis]
MLITSLLGAASVLVCLGLGTSMAQKVAQAQTAISGLEKEAVTMDCVYETSDPAYSLFWYKQPPSGEMIFLIRQDSYSEHSAMEGRYSLSFQKAARNRKGTRPWKGGKTPGGLTKELSSLALELSVWRQAEENAGAVLEELGTGKLAYPCPFVRQIPEASPFVYPIQFPSVRGMQVEQSPPALVLQEGANSTLSCSFSDSVTTVQWFRQDPGGRLVNLFYIPSGTKQNGRLEATTVPKERHSSLHISFSQPTDSATYFCAATHTAPQAPAAATQTLSWAQPRASHSTSWGHCSTICTV